MRARRWIWRSGAVVTFVLAAGGLARANPITLQDQNSSAIINLDPGVQDDQLVGMTNWTVDGANKLFDQWFAFRYQDANWLAGPDGATQQGPLDSLGGAPVVNQTAPNKVDITYNNGNIEVDVSYALYGNAIGSLQGTIQEDITITNLMSRPLNAPYYDPQIGWTTDNSFKFFQYSDFDLCGAASSDSVSISYGGASQSSFCDGVISETTVNPQAGNQNWPNGDTPGGNPGFDAGSPETLAPQALNGVDLSNNGSFTGGDAAFAFEWSIPLNPGESFTIDKTKSLAPVPEPMSLALLGVGLVGAGRMVRRRRNGAAVAA